MKKKKLDLWKDVGNIVASLHTELFIHGPSYKKRKDSFDSLKKAGIIADRNWQSQVSYAGGGMVGDKSGPPPESGPMSQGLRSLYINDKDY